jgi:hypothetical protein
MLVMTPPILHFIFAGEELGEFASSHWLACIVASCFLGFGILAWVFYKEWQAEFVRSPMQKKTTTPSWIMGLVVIIAFIGVCSGWAHRHHATMRGSVLMVGRAARELRVDLAATASQSFAELDNLLIVEGVRAGMRRGQKSDWSVSTGC